MNRILIGVALSMAAVAAWAQAPSKTRLMGEIATLDAAKNELVVRASDGVSTTVQLDEATKLMRVPPGEKDLAKAEAIKFEDLGAGDRVLVRGGSPPSAIIVMTKADIAKKHAADRAEWQKRGIAGTVTTVDPAAKTITVSARVAEGRKDIVIDAGEAVSFRRYAPDSVRFTDARPSALAEMQTGDHLRALGAKSADGAGFKAEEIVFGSFQSIAGVIKGVDAATGEITITNLDTKKPVIIRVNSDTTMKKLPEMLASMLAMRLRASVSATAPAAAPAGARPGGARGNMDFADMLERMPALNIADLKSGDAIILSATKGADAARATAITVVAGVEPLLTAAPERSVGTSWNFEIGMPTM